MIANESRQAVMKILGEYGCYYLSVIHLAEEITNKRIDAVEFFVKALRNKWLDNEATMLMPNTILGSLTNAEFDVIITDAAYQAEDSEYEILLFKNETAKGTYRHFVLGNGKGQVAYDPLGNSNAVAQGALAEKRIFRRK